MVEKKEKRSNAQRVSDVKSAVNVAVHYLKAVTREAHEIRVEETEFDEARKHWVITLSFEAGTDAWLSDRQFKEFRIKVEDGTVLSMKIRKIG